MGLMKTLTKVAIGIAVAEGTRMVLNRKSGSTLGRSSGGAGGIEKMVKDLIGGKSSSTTRNRANAPSGGIGDLLASGGIGGALGGMLGGLGGGAAKPQEEELEAALLLRVMIGAIKADGQLDDAEKARLMEAAGDASESEIAFLNQELASTIDAVTLSRQVPRGMEEKAYTAALLAIDLDQRAEAEYLHAFAEALGLSRPEVNAIHDQYQAPRIYD